MTRNLVVQAWGTPHETVGSVNEPREMEENGYRFNEKWVYRLSPTQPDQPTERIIYFARYDFVGACLVTKSGVVTEEDVGRMLASKRDRRYHPPAR